jgi:signal transduction histidine kinase
VSYGIVSEHRGRIHVASTVGSGSRFSVYLPVAKVPS